MSPMKRMWIVIAFAFAARLDAGLTYRTETITDGVRTRTFAGIVKSDSDRSRFEVTRSDEKMFEAGSVLLTSGKDSAITVLNPSKKTYYVLDLTKIGASLGEAQKKLAPFMTIPKPVATVKSEGAGGLVEGYPTQRWLIDGSMQMTTRGESGGRTFTMRTEIWTTEKLPASASSILDSSRLPGDPVLDALREAHAKVKGFPLKSVTVMNMTIGGSATTTTSRTTVTGIRSATFPASDFVIPAGYEQVESPIDAMLGALGSR